MSATQSARCLLGRPLLQIPSSNSEWSREAARLPRALAVARRLPTRTTPCARRSFHASRPCQARRKRFSSIQAEKLGLITPEKTKEFAQRYFPPLEDEDYKALEQYYTKEQIEAIKVGEKAIDPEDLAIQARWRTDAYKFPYWDDFSNYMPSIDKFPVSGEPPVQPDPRSRWMTQEEFEEDFTRWMAEQDGVSKQEFDAPWDGMQPDITDKMLDENRLKEYLRTRSVLTGGYQSDRRTASAMAPALPAKVPGVVGLYHHEEETTVEQDEAQDAKSKEEKDDNDGEGEGERGKQKKKKRKKSATPDMELGPEVHAIVKHGWTEGMLSGVALRTIEAKNVVNQTRLGKVYSRRHTVIAGNGDGWIGMGMAKGVDDTVVPLKAKALAIMNMRPIRRYEDRTVYGSVKAKFGGTQVELYPRPPGFGLRVPQNIWHICRFAGLKDLAARMPRANNKMNTVKATIEALHSQKDPEQIALGRGKKLVDVRKVYYGGNVY